MSEHVLRREQVLEAPLERTFDFVQTYDRTTVTQAAHSILRRYPKTNS